MATQNSFDWLSLDTDEEVLWSGNPRMHSIIPALIVGIPLSFVGIGLLIIAGAYLHIKNTDFVVTSNGLYRKTGVLSRNVQKIGFDKVQNISFTQGVLGNYFGYGNIDISTAGGSGVEMRFSSIEDPKTVQELINRHIKEDKGETAKSEHQLLEEILEETRKTRKLMEKLANN